MLSVLQALLILLALLAVILCLKIIVRGGAAQATAGNWPDFEPPGRSARPASVPPEGRTGQGTGWEPSGDRYRVQPGSSGGPKWDPYAADQSRVHRIQSARRRRPARPVHRGDGTEMAGMDYYTMLGIRRDATDGEIEGAYRRYVAEIHPDKFFDDPARRALAEARLKELNAVVAILRDPGRRARYDAGR